MINAPRFRSTAAFAARTRATAPAVERATFVTFSLGGRRFAAPVETVERVLRWSAVRPAGADHAEGDLGTVSYAGRNVPLVDLAGALDLEYQPSASSRALVLTVPGGWLAAVVDDVHEIATVEAASIEPIAPDRVDLPAGVRGAFMRHDREMLVLDIVRALGARRA